MKKPAKDRTSKSCQEYRASVFDLCELTGRTNCILEVHHILGRSRHEQSDYFTNLILIDKAVHSHGHDVSPASLEVRCLYAKWKRSLSVINIDEVYDPKYAIFDVESLDVLCDGGGFVGRIGGILLPKLTDDKLICYANELLKALGE